MQIELDKLDIIHDPSENRFETWVDGQLAKLDYIERSDTIVMTHVGVPYEFRGRGLAGKITQTGLEYARAKSLRVIPMCSYVAAYIRRHPEYQALTK